MKVPFSLLPAAWGLKGKTREIAEAEYYLTGYSLKKRLLEINHDDYTEKERKEKMLAIEFEFNKITKSSMMRSLADLIEDETLSKLAILELDHTEKVVSDLEYEKAKATLKNEPWVNVVNMDFTKGTSLEGNFELDWNELFVAKLELEGYKGPTPDNIVNQWFLELCRNVALEEFDGSGDFTGDSEANLQQMKRWNNDQVSSEGKRVHK